jgi:hypothetical protein
MRHCLALLMLCSLPSMAAYAAEPTEAPAPPAYNAPLEVTGAEDDTLAANPEANAAETDEVEQAGAEPAAPASAIPFPLVCSVGNLVAIEPAKVTDYDYRTLLMVEKVDNQLFVSPLGRSDYSGDFRVAFLGEYQILVELPNRILSQQSEQRVGSMLGLSIENDNIIAALSVQMNGGLFGGVGICDSFTEPTLP